jgi:hypothetical protein
MSEIAEPIQQEVLDAIEESRSTELIDGYIIDAETGEVLGIESPRPAFAVVDQSSCDWVMNKMLEAEADVAAIDHSPVVLHAKAVLENAAQLKKQRQRRVDFLHHRFDTELGEYARQKLIGQKSKTLKTLFGSISLRIVRGGVRVFDEIRAIEWARRCFPDAIKTSEEFLISALPADEKKRIAEQLQDWVDVPEADDEMELHRAFVLQADKEKIAVKVGVKAQEGDSE